MSLQISSKSSSVVVFTSYQKLLMASVLSLLLAATLEMPAGRFLTDIFFLDWSATAFITCQKHRNRRMAKPSSPCRTIIMCTGLARGAHYKVSNALPYMVHIIMHTLLFMIGYSTASLHCSSHLGHLRECQKLNTYLLNNKKCSHI